MKIFIELFKLVIYLLPFFWFVYGLEDLYISLFILVIQFVILTKDAIELRKKL